MSLSSFAPENDVVPRDRFGRPVPRQPARSPYSGGNLVLTRGISPAFREVVHLFIPPTAIGSVPSLYK